MVFSLILKSWRSSISTNYKSGQRFAKRLDLKDIQFSVKIRDIHKISKNFNISGFGYEKKIIKSMYEKKCYEENHVDLLTIGEEGNRQYVPINVFNTFMYDHTLHCLRKHLCHYCLQSFSTEEILKRHIKNWFKINVNQTIILPKNGEYVNFKNYEIKIMLPFIIYADFESILKPEDNGKQNTEGSHTNRYQKHTACSSGYKLVYANNKFSKLF